MQIKRRVYYTVANGQKVVDGEFVDYSIKLIGRYTPERATRKARKKEGDESITINNVEVFSEFRAMDIDTFLQHSIRTSQRKES